MSLKFVPSRIIAAAALTVVLAGGCAATNTPASTAAASPTTREQDAVVTCYATGFRKRSGFSPTLDAKTDASAEQLLKKHNGSVKRACDVISSALSTASCGGATTLGALLACDPRMMRSADIDPASKASLETRIRNRGQEGSQPTQSPAF